MKTFFGSKRRFLNLYHDKLGFIFGFPFLFGRFICHGRFAILHREVKINMVQTQNEFERQYFGVERGEFVHSYSHRFFAHPVR